jgi:Rieske Fe-S protein
MTENKSTVERRTVLLAGGAATTAVLTGCIVQEAAPPAPSTQPAQPATSAPPSSAGSAPASQGTASADPGKPPLAQLADIPAGGGVILKEQNVVLTKDASGKVSAFSAICTHQGCVVTGVGGGTIDCPCHGSRFDAATGERVAGPAQSPLPPVAVEQRDGAVFRA